MAFASDKGRQGAAGQGAGGYEIDNSLRFNDDDTAKLVRTPSTSGSQDKMTFSFWCKRGNLGYIQSILNDYAGGYEYASITFLADDTLSIVNRNSSNSTFLNLSTTQVFRDASAWYHIVIKIDTTITSPSGTNQRVNLYVNGEQVTDFSTAVYPSSAGLDTTFNKNKQTTLFAHNQSGSGFDGYLAEVNFIDGLALDQYDFGEFDATYGHWKPKAYTENPFSGNIKHTITAVGDATTDSTTKKWGSGSVKLDGTNDYLQFDDPILDKGTDYTLEGWFNPTIINRRQELVFQYASGQNGRFLIYILDNNKLEVFCKQSDGGTSNVSTTSTVSANTWHHFAYCVDSSGNARLYLNGTLEGTVAGWTQVPYQGIDFSIGKRYSASSNYFAGYLDDVRYSDTARYTGSSLTVPTEEFTDDANTVFLVQGNGSIEDASGMVNAHGTNGFYLPFDNTGTKHTITSGGVTLDTTTKKFGTSSIAFDGSSDYIKLGSSSDFAYGTNDFTIECWVKFDTLVSGSDDSGRTIYDGRASGSTASRPMLNLNDSGKLSYSVSSTQRISVTASSVLGTTAFHHIAVSRNGASTRMFVDGDQVGSTWTTDTTNYLTTAAGPYMGALFNPAYGELDGYMDEIRISSTARYTDDFDVATSAFEPDDDTLLLIHADGSIVDASGYSDPLGTDLSGGSNHWTTNNLSITDQMLDSPTNNFATLNPLHRDSTMTPTEGNTNVRSGSSSSWQDIATSIVIPSAGKWYWEAVKIGTGSGTIGIANANAKGYLGNTGSHVRNVESVFYAQHGYKYILDSSSSYGSTFTNGDIIGIAVDMDNDAIYFRKGTTWQNSGIPTSGASQTGAIADEIVSSVTYLPMFQNASSGNGWNVNFGQDSSFAGNKAAQGNTDSNDIGDFFYEPPSGFLALCTQNLPEPTVVPSENFNTITWTGNGGTGYREYTGVGFKPDLVWAKNRSGAFHHAMYNSISGAGATTELTPNEDYAEGGNNPSEYDYLSSFEDDGFKSYRVGSNRPYYFNDSIYLSYVAWNWKAGGAAVTNTDGTITSSVSANPTAGFSIVSYTGAGNSVAKVGHGLDYAPEMVIVKARTLTGKGWPVYAESLGTSSKIVLNSTGAASVNNEFNAAPTNTVFSLKSGSTWTNSSSGYIAYCFHSVDGYSKVGSYTGTGSSPGPFIHTGFKPAYVMIKCTTTTNNSSFDSWTIIDNARSPSNDPNLNEVVYANHTVGEGNRGNASTNYGGGVTPWLQFHSNGFVTDSGSNEVNYNNETYIYIAFAEHPFKYSTAK